MSTWSEGYVSDIDYTYGYYSELNPQQMVIPLLMAGIAPPEVGHACELGFGQGISVGIHAAGGSAVWHATDFNPGHTAFARNLEKHAASGRLNAYDQSFAEFCQRPDLPDFDYIGLHGIWSWITDDNRRIITDFVRRKLKPGGILYLSYNTLPGWSAIAPMRHLLSQSALSHTNQSRTDNIRSALGTTAQILTHSHLLTQQSPQLSERLKQLNEQNPHYVIHEYLNQNWQPMYYAEVEAQLESAKMRFACSANYLNDFTDCLFNPEQKNLLQTITNPSLRQTVKDYLLNTQFRSDLWIKGARALGRREKTRLWDQLDIILTVKRDTVELLAEKYYSVQLLPELFNPVLDLLADQRPHNVGQLRQALPGLNEDTLHTILAVLFGKRNIAVVKTPDHSSRQAAHNFNRHILENTLFEHDISYLCSPLTGGGIYCNTVELLFLQAILQGIDQNHWVEYAWKQLQQHQQVLLSGEKRLQTEEENVAELVSLQTEFLTNRWPVLQNLDIIPALK